MAVAPDTFRSVFPEFTAEAYPTPAVTFWLGQGAATLPKARLGQQFDLAVMLYAAHNLTLGKLSAKSGAATSIAPVASAKVGEVSKSYGANTATSANAGIYNATAYGLRLWALLRGLATGGFYRPSARAGQIRAAEGIGPFSR